MTLTTRLASVEERLARLEAQMHAAPATPAPAQSNGNGEPRWLDSARFGGKKCPGGCGRVVQQGSRGWYEPKIVTARGTVPAQLFCVPCGEDREKALKP